MYGKSQYHLKPTTLRQNVKWKFRSRGYLPDDFRPKVPMLFRHLLYRFKLNYTTLILIVGQIRTGKSYLAMKIAEKYCKLLNKEFDIEKQLSFDLLPFLEWAKSGVKDSVFILDEVGTKESLSSLNWYDPLSITVNDFLQTQGFRRNVVILVLPNASFLLKKIRFMMNYVIETKYQGYGYIKRLSMDNIRSKGYYSNMGVIKYKKPKKKTCNIYEEIKLHWNNEKLDRDINNLRGINLKKAQDRAGPVLGNPQY